MRKILLQIIILAFSTAAFAQTEAKRSTSFPGDPSDPSLKSRPAEVDSVKKDSSKYFKQFNLQEVTVNAQRKLIKNDIDRMSYDVQHDKDSRAMNTLEMLRKVPMVSVDGQDNIKVKGSVDFKIYRNGHPDPSFSGGNASLILKSIPATMIKRIEVITDPGAKEDAEGTHYILNIVMNDDAKINGVTGTLGSAVDVLHGSSNENGYITAQTGKLIFSVNYGYVYAPKGATQNKQHSDTFFKNSGDTRYSSMFGNNPVNVHYGNLNASYTIDSLNLFTLSFGGYYYKVKVNSNGTDRMTDANQNILYQYDTRLWTPKYDDYNLNGRMDYQHKTKLDGEVLTASYMLSTTRSVNNEQTTYSNMVNMPVDYSGYDKNQKEHFIEHTFQLDYVRPFLKYNKMEIGAKYINRENNSNTSMLYDGSSASIYNKFDHNTQIAAGYGEWVYANKKWSARAGLRYEYSYLDAKYPDKSGQNFHKNLNDWVPSASIKYNFNMFNSLKISYATTINRPGISYLDPADVSTPTAESYGNPGLNSARNTSFTLEYMHINPKFTYNLSPYYNFSNNQISAIQFAKEGKTVSTFDDVLHTKNLGIGGFIQASPFKNTSIMLNANIGKNFMNNHQLGISLNGWSGMATANITQTLPWKIRLNVGYGGSFGQNVSSVYGYDSNWHYHYIALQRSFLKEDRLTVMIGADNPFGNKYLKMTSRTVNGDYTGHQFNYQQTKELGFRISYRFGKLKASVKRVENTIENNDVVGGIKSGASSSQGMSGGQK